MAVTDAAPECVCSEHHMASYPRVRRLLVAVANHMRRLWTPTTAAQRLARVSLVHYGRRRVPCRAAEQRRRRTASLFARRDVVSQGI